MKPAIGVIGSAACSDEEILQKAKKAGEEIALHGCHLLSGATTGVSYEAVKGAKEKGGFIVGVSPAENMREHTGTYRYPANGFDILIFTGAGRKGRNVPFIRSCDAVILIAGRIGTLNEFTIAYDEGKIIGVLSETSGISEMIPEIVKRCAKKGGRIIYDNDPKRLLERILAAINGENSVLQSS